MKKSCTLFGIALLLFLVPGQQVFSQGVLKKLKEKTQKDMLDAVFGKEKEGQPAEGSTTGAVNTRGGGLDAPIPDVKENIRSAESAYMAKNYQDARYSARQALLGVELEIGRNIIKELPGSVAGLDADTAEDRVTTSGIGFVGLTIYRIYRKADQAFTVTMGNDAALISPVNMYLASGAYGADTQQSWKQTKYKGYRAVIDYDESKGYTLSVPFGQSSIIIFEGVNIASEQAMMSAAEQIDIEKIKKELGEK